MIRARLEGTAEVRAGLEAIQTVTRNFTSVAGDLWRQAYSEVHPAFLSDLQDYPPAKRGSRYIRTGRLKRGWVLRFLTHGNLFEVVVENKVPYARWVVGTFGRQNFQTAMHRETGWMLANTTATFWFGEMNREFQERFERYLNGVGVFKVTRRNR